MVQLAHTCGQNCLKLTLIVGYIYRNTAQVIADSAITYDNEFVDQFNVQNEEVTAFGEAVVITDDVTVVESAQKLIQLSTNAVGAFSGISTEGFNTLNDLQIIFRTAAGAPVSNLLQEYFQQNEPKNTDYIIAFHEENQAKLLGYSKKVINIVIRQDVFFMFGSGRDNAILRSAFGAKYNSWISDSQLKAPPDEMLVGAVTTCQLASLNALTINQGAGGFYNGAYVTSDSVIWAPDTFNFMYSWVNMKGASHFVVQKYNRDQGTLFYSTILGGSKILLNMEGSLPPETWLHKWREYLLQKAMRAEADYFVFTSYDRMIASIFHKSIFERSPSIFKIEHIPPNKNEFTFSEFMLDVLSGKLADCKVGPNTICVNFYTA